MVAIGPHGLRLLAIFIFCFKLFRISKISYNNQTLFLLSEMKNINTTFKDALEPSFENFKTHFRDATLQTTNIFRNTNILLAEGLHFMK